MVGICKFCGCTENAPCVTTGPEGMAVCAWLLDDVCTNPDCVLKAYLEAWPQAEELMQKLDPIFDQEAA